MKTKPSKQVREWCAENGRKGGRALAMQITDEQRKEWSAKGGRNKRGWRKIKEVVTPVIAFVMLVTLWYLIFESTSESEVMPRFDSPIAVEVMPRVEGTTLIEN